MEISYTPQVSVFSSMTLGIATVIARFFFLLASAVSGAVKEAPYVYKAAALAFLGGSSGSGSIRMELTL